MNKYFNDGANNQAQAVLAFLGELDIEDSWNNESKKYDAIIDVARWKNCREQGYVIFMENTQMDQINIAFFEHRNSDEICAVVWNQNFEGIPCLEKADFGDTYKNKWDVSFSVGYGEIPKMCQFIKDNLNRHWKK